MKILCDKDEFALLVRECQLCEAMDNCRGCFFAALCSAVENEAELYAMSCIEDICEIVTKG